MKIKRNNYEIWLDILQYITKYYRMDFSIENTKVMIENMLTITPALPLVQLANKVELNFYASKADMNLISPSRLPLVLVFQDGQVGIMTKMDGKGSYVVLLGGDGGVESIFDTDFISKNVTSYIVLRPRSNVKDARVDSYIQPFNKSWFWNIALSDWRKYIDIIVVSCLANILALSGMLFSMQVYDRVVPAQSESTLWVLFLGVMIAILFEFFMRMLRSHISDVIGKRADLRISDHVFSRALRIRSDARPKSTGTFISQLRELESVRDLITSTTLSALADLPFFILFVIILWSIGGPLSLVVLLAVPLIIIPGVFIQIPLAKLSNEGMRESAIRNATLVEAIQGIDDIKLLRAEQRFENQWNHSCSVSAAVSMKQRFITNLLMTWTQELQSMVYAFVLLYGAYLVISGDITTGALVGSSILASRTVAPLAQISGVLSRWQSAKVALKGLNELMKRPVDHPDNKKMVHKQVLHGDYVLKDVDYFYDDESKISNLHIDELKIFPGEKIAILGRNGSGKSTLLRVLSGLLVPKSGSVQLDNVNLNFIDPADVRRDVGLLEQHANLFFGSIRENVTMGRPMASEDEIQHALTLSGAITFVSKQKEGLNHIIHEGGLGLSGGEKQALLLARHFICNYNVSLLDEPTSLLDDVSEKKLISSMSHWLNDKTLIVATHRLSILGLVDRIIVIDNGKVVLDGPRDNVIKDHFSHNTIKSQ